MRGKSQRMEGEKREFNKLDNSYIDIPGHEGYGYIYKQHTIL